jgi:hypothetical protein
LTEIPSWRILALMKYLETLSREFETVKGTGTTVLIEMAMPGSTPVCSKLLCREIPCKDTVHRLEAIAGRKQGEIQTMSSLKLGRENLRLINHRNSGADRQMAAENNLHFEALVATIRQRDAADGRATFWQRAFFRLAWIASAASAAVVLVWMKGCL